MSKVFYDLTGPDQWMNYRWVQPPQIVYLVSTLDASGNVNVTPVTLGTCVGVNVSVEAGGPEYHFAFSVRRRDLPDLPATQAYRNLLDTPECTIAFPTAALSEKVPGIAECPVNLEGRVAGAMDVGDYFRLFLVSVVGVSVDSSLVALDEAQPERPGLLNIDPIFEVAIAASEQRPPRMLFAGIARDHWLREPDEIGPRQAWIGSFEGWIDDEVGRGRLGDAERAEILALRSRWESDPDPERNAVVKDRLTRLLAALVRDQEKQTGRSGKLR
jgi:flavin reductase (DIM6/NTAB) family NADH-FMN oxidoreductase RutF